MVRYDFNRLAVYLSFRTPTGGSFPPHAAPLNLGHTFAPDMHLSRASVLQRQPSMLLVKHPRYAHTKVDYSQPRRGQCGEVVGSQAEGLRSTSKSGMHQNHHHHHHFICPIIQQCAHLRQYSEKSRTARSDKNTNSCPERVTKTVTARYTFYHTSKKNNNYADRKCRHPHTSGGRYFCEYRDGRRHRWPTSA